jgi:superoxide reductase
MTKKMEVYKCEICGNMVEMVHEGGGTLVCCGQNMTLMAENSTDAAQEKHVPVIEKTGNGYNVKVGSAAHPMEDKHYIEWIELVAGDVSQRVFLKPGDAPEASFCTDAAEVTARAYCNLHGLWRG